MKGAYGLMVCVNIYACVRSPITCFPLQRRIRESAPHVFAWNTSSSSAMRYLCSCAIAHACVRVFVCNSACCARMCECACSRTCVHARQCMRCVSHMRTQNLDGAQSFENKLMLAIAFYAVCMPGHRVITCVITSMFVRALRYGHLR